MITKYKHPIEGQWIMWSKNAEPAESGDWGQTIYIGNYEFSVFKFKSDKQWKFSIHTEGFLQYEENIQTRHDAI